MANAKRFIISIILITCLFQLQSLSMPYAAMANEAENNTRGNFLVELMHMMGMTPDLNELIKRGVIEKNPFNDAMGVGDNDGYYSLAKWEGIVLGEITDLGADMLYPCRKISNIEALTIVLRCIDKEFREMKSCAEWEEKAISRGKEYGIGFKNSHDELSDADKQALFDLILNSKTDIYFGKPYYFYDGNGITNYQDYTYKELLTLAQ